MRLAYCPDSANTCVFLPSLMRVILLEASEIVIQENFSVLVNQADWRVECCCCKANTEGAAV